MSKIIKLFKQKKFLIMLVLFAVSLILIPSYKHGGAEVSFVFKDSPFAAQIREGDLISSINGVQINSLGEYKNAIFKVKPGDALKIETQKGAFSAQVNATPFSNDTAYLGVNVKGISKTRINLGLELQGGARVTLKPILVEGANVSADFHMTTAAVLAKRLDAYGLKGVIPRQIEDFQNNKYLVVEMAGEGSEKLVDLVKSVGKFEIRVLNETIFGGEEIIPPIGEASPNPRTGTWQVPLNIKAGAADKFRNDYLRLAPQQPGNCAQEIECGEGFSCSSPDVGYGGAGLCLPSIQMLLDGREEFSAPPAQSLYQSWKRGEETASLVVQTKTQEDAVRVKVVLEAGRLPSQIESIEIISQDYVDPKLGSDFFRSAAIAGVAAIILVGVVLFIRYRKFKIAIPIAFTGLAEVVILLGIAAAYGKWVIDLASIAGIIASVGTGVEQQIIITDEILGGDLTGAWDIKKRTKIAFGIILVAIATAVVAMLPLLWEGMFPGLYALKGFAIATIIGFLIGYFITRPAYAQVAEVLLLEETQ